MRADIGTIAVDTSALVAIFPQEEGPVDFALHLHRSFCLIGWPTLLEFLLVMTSRTGCDDQNELIDYLKRQPNIRLVPFGSDHFRMAADAFLRYGKGRHPAQLNDGDCLAYAVAKQAGIPLLFKGDDFAKTDLHPAMSIR